MNTFDVLHPAIGSNQHLVKFDSKVKRKWKVKFGTKIKIVAIVILLASLLANWYLLKTNYVFNCNVTIGNITQAQAGHLMSKTKCDSINQDWIEARNYEASQRDN